jgi:hypothetical protein
MLNINEEDLKVAIVQKAADEILSQDDDLSGLIANEVKSRLDKIFIDRAEAQISETINDAITAGFEREYQRINRWGEPEGEKTTIKAQLDKIISGYWNQNVDKNGKPDSSNYGTMTRAEWLMTKICAEDFSKSMQQQAVNMTAHLKDGLRGHMAQMVNGLLDNLFKVKSWQDQDATKQPW